MQVVELKTFKSEAQEEIIERLEKLLKDAKTGAYEGFAYCGVRADGSTDTGFTTSVNFHTLLSGVVILQHRMLNNRPGRVD